MKETASVSVKQKRFIYFPLTKRYISVGVLSCNAVRHKGPDPQVFLKMIILIFCPCVNSVLGFTLSGFGESLADMTLDFHVMIVEYLKRETKTAAYSVLLTQQHYPRRFCKEQSSFTAFFIVLSVTWQATTVNHLLRIHNSMHFSQCAWMTVRYDIISKTVLKRSPGLRFLIFI